MLWKIQNFPKTPLKWVIQPSHCIWNFTNKTKLFDSSTYILPPKIEYPYFAVNPHLKHKDMGSKGESNEDITHTCPFMNTYICTSSLHHYNANTIDSLTKSLKIEIGWVSLSPFVLLQEIKALLVFIRLQFISLIL